MKTLVMLPIFLSALLLSPSIAADEVIQLEIRFRGLPKKWLEFTDDSELKRRTTEEGFSPFPATVSKLGHPVTASITKEYPLIGADDEDPKIGYGVSVAVTPKRIDQKLFLFGKVVLTRVAQEDTVSGTVRLETQEILIRSDVEDGKALSVRLEDGGSVLLTPTLLDAVGHRLKQTEVEQAGTGQPATRPELKSEGSD
jgi:hypothetical protein